MIICSPPKPTCTILLIRGGATNSDTPSYVRITAALVSNTFTTKESNYRIYLFKLNVTCMSHKIGHHINDGIKYIKSKHKEPLIAVGFSLGGVSLLSYLAFGYDDADYYILTCSPLNINHFMDVTVNKYVLFKFLKQGAYSYYNVSTDEEFLKLSNTTVEEETSFYDKLLDTINKPKILRKIIYIIGDGDPTTLGYEEDIKQFKIRPKTIIVKQGYHCCMNVIICVSEIITRYADKLRK
jgi:hypothetical protein